MYRCLPAAMVCLLVLTCWCSPAVARFGDLTSRVPNDANTLVMVDVEKLTDTALARKEGWATEHEEAFRAGLLAIPPDATRFVAAAKTDFATLDPKWSMALMNMTQTPSFPEVATRYSGSVDKVEGKDLVLLPGDLFAMKFSEKVLVAGSPAVRQDVSRYIKQVYGNRTGNLSEYLEEAEEFAEKSSPIIMAMDLSGAMSVAEIQRGLAKFSATHNFEFDADQAAEVLASIRGVSLGIRVDDKRIGAVKVDFEKNIEPIKEIAKPLMLAALANHGATIDEFYDWKVTSKDKSIQLIGVLEKSGMRRIMSLLDPPPSLRYAEQDPESPKSKEQLQLEATKLYFKSVESLLDDLKADKKRRKNMAQLSVWFRKYADRIDGLPMLNVDPEMLDYGLYVSTTLRGGANTVTEAGQRKMVRQQEVPEQYSVSTWSRPVGVTNNWWGGSQAYSWNGWSAKNEMRTKMNMQAKIRMQENFAGGYSAEQTLQEVAEATARIRRHMVEKYSADF
ncbi:MAG: hypothetical protein AAGD11_20080 [Planctomycetota bacterium]